MRLTSSARVATALTTLGMLAACAGTGGSSESSADYPSDEIRLIVPYDAGGPTDLTARAYGGFLEQELGQPVVVENLPGGSGAVATQELIGSPPDGYTLALVTAGTSVLTPLANDVGYTKDDIAPIGVMAKVPSLLAVGADSPYQDAKSFFDAARANPGKLNVAVPGASTPQAVELMRLRKEHGIQVTAVPFDGNAEMTTALLGSSVDAVLINASSDVTENIDAGKFVPLAVSPQQRLDWLPGTPTLVELGFTGLTLSGSTFGLAGPAGLPDHIRSKLEGALSKASQDPGVIRRVGERYVPGSFGDADVLKKELDKTQKVYEPIL